MKIDLLDAGCIGNENAQATSWHSIGDTVAVSDTFQENLTPLADKFNRDCASSGEVLDAPRDDVGLIAASKFVRSDLIKAC